MRALVGKNFVALRHHGQVHTTSCTQNVRYFWLSVQGFALPSLASKLRLIAAIRKKQRKQNDMGYQKYGLKLEDLSTVKALGVKVYWGQN